MDLILCTVMIVSFRIERSWQLLKNQTALSCLIRVYTVCHSLIFSTHYSMVKPYCSTLKAITAFELPHDKMTVCPAKTQISLGNHPVWSESSLCALWVAKDPNFLQANSEDSVCFFMRRLSHYSLVEPHCSAVRELQHFLGASVLDFLS